jgi:hypothetical protein
MMRRNEQGLHRHILTGDGVLTSGWILPGHGGRQNQRLLLLYCWDNPYREGACHGAIEFPPSSSFIKKPL